MALLSPHRVEEVKPWIARDVGRYQSSSAKALIGMLLSLCLEDASHGDRDTNIKLFDASRKSMVSEWGKISSHKKQPMISALKK